jgi:hypothetical protein
MHLRADVSQKVLDRYCSDLAVVDDTTTLDFARCGELRVV